MLMNKNLDIHQYLRLIRLHSNLITRDIILLIKDYSKLIPPYWKLNDGNNIELANLDFSDNK